MSDLSAYWDSRADREETRERDNPRKRVHTDLLWRLIDGALPGGECAILDACGGTGRFSLPLSARGHEVTHLDISPRMLELASARAAVSGRARPTFCRGDIVDLSRFADGSFDVVLCLDSPLSFAYPDHAVALDELVRVCRRSLVLCVMSRFGVILEGGITFDLKHFGRPKTVVDVFRTGDLSVTPELKELQPLMPSWHAFTIDEIEAMLTERGMTVTSAVAPGALATSVPADMLAGTVSRAEDYRSYLDFEEAFDSQKAILGLAVGGAGGLAVVAERGPAGPGFDRRREALEHR